MDELRRKVDEYLCSNRDKWIEMGKTLQRMPEMGFCEYKTGAYAADFFTSLGMTPQRFIGTGSIVRLPGRSHAVNVALEGELDAIYCPEHPLADPETGLAHACGHNIQITALLAAAAALKETGVMSELDGDVTFIAVPAEECIPTDVLARLHREGKIESDSGKREMLRRGMWKGIDVVLGSHALVNDETHPDSVMINTSCNGLVVLRFTFHGRTAHSTVCPEKGINALNAAILAINGIQALREAFDPAEHIRVSYNLTDGCSSIGNIPDTTCLEVVIATKTMPALTRLQKQVETSARCGAQMLGCTVDIQTEIGYLPYAVDEALLENVQACVKDILGEVPRPREHNYFSNDLGDVSQIIPTAQVVFGGFAGDLHSPMFRVTDEEKAYLTPARTLAGTLVRLLENGAQHALEVKEHFARTHAAL